MSSIESTPQSRDSQPTCRQVPFNGVIAKRRGKSSLVRQENRMKVRVRNLHTKTANLAHEKNLLTKEGRLEVPKLPHSVEGNYNQQESKGKTKHSGMCESNLYLIIIITCMPFQGDLIC